MIKPLIASSLCVLALSGCLTDESQNDQSEAAKKYLEEATVPVASQSEDGSAKNPLSIKPRPLPQKLSDEELTSLFQSKAYKNQFRSVFVPASEIEPELSEDEQKTMREFAALIAAEKKDEAEALIRSKLTPASSARFEFLLGTLHFQRDETEQAAKLYELAVQKFEKYRSAWYLMAQIHVRESHYGEAVEAFTKVIELGQRDAITYGFLGVSHSKMGNHIAAEGAFREATMMDPDNVDWKMGLADSFFRQGRLAEAVSLFNGLIEKEPNRADLWLAQGMAYAQLNQPLMAAENFEMVDRLGKSTVDSLNNLGDIYSNQELYDMAVAAYGRAMKKDPAAKPDRHLRAAKFICTRGGADESKQLISLIEETYSTRLDLNQKKDLLRLRARLAMTEGATDKEAAILENIVSMDPRDGAAMLLLGEHARKNDNPEKAKVWFERAAGIEGFEPDAWCGQARLLVAQSKYAEAVPLLRKAQKVRPRDRIQRYLDQVERVAKSTR